MTDADAEDERSIANRLEAESNKKDGDDDSEETKLSKQDATLPVSTARRNDRPIIPLTFMTQARSHGNEPSKGAKIDQELREEEEAILKKKGAFGPKDS